MEIPRYDKSFGMPSEICIMILDGLVNESNGAEFVPSSGDYVGVVCDNGDDYQVTFIEIPYVAAAPELAPVAMAVALVSPASDTSW